ncbi:CBWD5 [Symbiodinium sp. CCMP2592]|nr:CBWD5 [Symbiodinium sp. CCMP2592]
MNLESSSVLTVLTCANFCWEHPCQSVFTSAGDPGNSRAQVTICWSIGRCGRSRSGSAWLKSKIAVVTFLSPTANPPWIDIAMKPACVVACLFALAFKAGVSADTLRVDGAGTDVVDARGTETADACQSGSLIQRLSSSHKVLSDTEATPAESLKKTSEIKEKKKKLKKQKSNKKHSDFMAFLAEAEKDGPGHPEGSECEPAGALAVSRVVCDFRMPRRPRAPLLGENRAKFELLSQKVFALDLDPVLARLVKKSEYAPKLAKRAADEYRKFLVLMGMGETPIASKMVLDAWHSHIMYTKMYERDCQEVFGHQLEHDPLGEQLEETRLKQTQQQICDYFGMVDRLVWSAAKPAALSESTDPSDTAAIMDQWLDHINEEVVLRKGLLAEDVHVMVASQHTNTAVTHTGLENALSFFHHYSHATKARKFLSADHEAFAIEIQKGKRMGADIFEVDSDGKILDVKIFMATLFKDVDDLDDTGLENLTVHYTGNGSMARNTYPLQAMVQVGEAGGALTKAAMETWMLNFNNNAAEKHDLLAADVHLTHMSQVTDAPETRDGKAEVIDFFRDFENATGAREFLSVDGGAFMIENKGNNLHPRMGLLIFEVNPEGKIQDIKIWVASLQGDRDDLSDSGLTSVAPSLLGSRGEEASVSGATEPAVCQQSGSRPSLQQMQRFNASVEKVKALDLDAVVAFLVKKDGYSPTKAAELAEEYRKYLALVSIGLSPVPSKKVDDAWHAHILNTKKYQADTRALLGHFLHHEPANLLLEQQGMKEQKSSMDNMFSRTKMQLCDYYGRVDEAAWSREDNPVDLVVFVRVTWTIQVVRVPMRLVSATSLQMPAVIGVLFRSQLRKRRDPGNSRAQVTICWSIGRCGRSRSGSAWLKSKIAVVTFLSPTANPPWIDIAMKPACVVACLFALAFKAGVSADTLRVDGAGTDVADARGTETADACQSGSLIQRLSSSHKVLSDTEATPAESLKKTPEIKEKKKKLKKQKSNKKHSDFMAFLAEAEKDGPGHPEGSECEPAGAPLLGENRAKFELLSQKVFALDLDPVLARLVKKSDYAPKLAKRAADEYRKFLVLMGMGETPIASKMVLDAWHSHIMPPVRNISALLVPGSSRETRYTKMYERDCQEVFGHQLENDPLGEQLEETRLKQTQQQICDYFGMVDRLVWSAAKPAALSESTDPSDIAAIMDQWLDHINEEVVLRKGLLAEDVHVMVASQHTNTAVTHTGLENALSFFHHYSHATKARKFLSADHEAFAIEIQKGKRMGADIFEVDSDGKILDVKIFMATLFKDVDDLNDTGLENLTVHYTGNGSMAMVQVGEAGGALTKAAMETWMLNFNNNAAEKHDLLAADVHLTHMSQVTDAPETRDGKAEVIDFFRDFENATGAREFLSVDGGAFMIENKGNNLHPRMGLLIFEVNPEGKIQDIKIWVASLQGDRDDLSDSGLTSVAPSLLGSRGEEASVSGATEPAVCQQSGSRPSLQQMQRFNASVEKVKALDLDAVVAFLVKKDGYSPAKAAELAEEYRKYLALVSIGLSPVPSKKVDDAWHAHILNTKKYQADTRALLGHFLHHEPANLLLEQQGMKEQKSSMDNMFSRTKMQLCDYYGRVDEAAWSKEDVALCASRSCKSGSFFWVYFFEFLFCQNPVDLVVFVRVTWTIQVVRVPMRLRLQLWMRMLMWVLLLSEACVCHLPADASSDRSIVPVPVPQKKFQPCEVLLHVATSGS